MYHNIIRYLLGKWASYEGLIYPTYDYDLHMIPNDVMVHEYWKLKKSVEKLSVIEAYDHGIANQSCYLYGYVDHLGNVGWIDGFYEAELDISNKDEKKLGIVERIQEIRYKYTGPRDNRILADPAIFRRTSQANNITKEDTVSKLIEKYGIKLCRANNDIQRGINMINQYLMPVANHINPYTKNVGGCYMYFNAKLTFIDDEITGYRWKKDSQSDNKEIPIDKNDHAMDTIKYGMTGRPEISGLIPLQFYQQPEYMKWHEYDERP